MSTSRRSIPLSEAALIWAQAAQLDRMARRSQANLKRFGPLRDQLYADLAEGGYPLLKESHE